jgi:hypothetical protein
MKNSVKKSKSMKSITLFFDAIDFVIRVRNFVLVAILVCVVGILALNMLFERTVIEEGEFKLLMTNLEHAGCQESRNALIKQVNSGKAISNGDASSSRSKCEEELRQTAYKAQ